jgi:hypothetical protein
VVQQVLDSDVLPARIDLIALARRWIELEQIEDGIDQMELAPVDELKDGDTGEGFGEAGNTKESIGLHGAPGLDVRIAAPARP